MYGLSFERFKCILIFSSLLKDCITSVSCLQHFEDALFQIGEMDEVVVAGFQSGLLRSYSMKSKAQNMIPKMSEGEKQAYRVSILLFVLQLLF